MTVTPHPHAGNDGETHSIRGLGLALAALLIGYAVYVAAARTAGLSWPYDADHFRDVAASETVLRHGLGQDPYYRGEAGWYNPLLPGLMAAIAAVSGLDLPVLYARAGTFLNIGAPLAFFALVRRTSGSIVAASALLAYIYVTPRGTQAWQTATYSPWLFAGTFAQPLFYGSLLAIQAMWRDHTSTHRLIVGVMLGLSLLTHTAPALLLATILACAGLAQVIGTRLAGSALRSLAADAAIVSAATLSIASPLLLPIFVRYGFNVVNRHPIEWSYELMDLGRLADLASTHATPATALALLGAWRYRTGSHATTGASPITFWAIANVLLLTVGYLQQLPALTWLPSLVPQFHFLSYFRALMAVFAGYGIVAVAEGLHGALTRITPAARRARPAYLAFALLAVASVAAMPRLEKRDDFGQPVSASETLAEQADRVAAYRWAKEHIGTADVVLAPDDLGQTVVGAAGKRVVAVDQYFSNPYVAHAPRAEARRAMYESVLGGNRDAFCTQADGYGVNWVAARHFEVPDGRAPSWLALAFSSGEIRFWGVQCPDVPAE